MPTPLKSLLTHLGLTKKEAAVYLASLRLGEANAQEIAHKAKLPRTTVASILERLLSSGFVSIQKKKGKHVYWIEDPHILIEKQKARLEVTEELVSRLHAEYHSYDKKPTAEVFDSREGILNLMTKAIEETPKGGEILVIESPGSEHYQAVLSDELFFAMSKMKTKKGIQTRALISSGQQGSIRPKSLEQQITIKALPSGITYESSMWLFSNSIVMFSGTHLFAVKIHNQLMYESMKSLFEHFWQLSSPLD